MVSTHHENIIRVEYRAILIAIVALSVALSVFLYFFSDGEKVHQVSDQPVRELVQA